MEEYITNKIIESFKTGDNKSLLYQIKMFNIIESYDNDDLAIFLEKLSSKQIMKLIKIMITLNNNNINNFKVIDISEIINDNYTEPEELLNFITKFHNYYNKLFYYSNSIKKFFQIIKKSKLLKGMLKKIIWHSEFKNSGYIVSHDLLFIIIDFFDNILSAKIRSINDLTSKVYKNSFISKINEINSEMIYSNNINQSIIDIHSDEMLNRLLSLYDSVGGLSFFINYKIKIIDREMYENMRLYERIIYFNDIYMKIQDIIETNRKYVILLMMTYSEYMEFIKVDIKEEIEIMDKFYPTEETLLEKIV